MYLNFTAWIRKLPNSWVDFVSPKANNGQDWRAEQIKMPSDKMAQTSKFRCPKVSTHLSCKQSNLLLLREGENEIWLSINNCFLVIVERDSWPLWQGKVFVRVWNAKSCYNISRSSGISTYVSSSLRFSICTCIPVMELERIPKFWQCSSQCYNKGKSADFMHFKN